MKMAASLCATALRALRISPCSTAASVSQSAGYCSRRNLDPKAHSRPETINQRRTQAEVIRALRPKQNFLHHDQVDKHRHSPLQQGTASVQAEHTVSAPRNYRYVMPEFMPRPEWDKRDRVFEKLERQDMLRRRAQINIPEFYVGSIMSVTVVDSFAPNKKNKFVGICIDRGDYGLKAWFILRNHVDGLGVEVMYDMYSPTILSMEVLKLEKRLDDQLYYLRDAPAEYSTFPFDMDPVPLPKGADVPLNTLKVPLKPSKEWHWRWEVYQPEGVQPFELRWHDKRMKRAQKSAEPWRKHDLMLRYRSEVPEEEEDQVMAEVYKEKQRIDASQRKTTLKKK